MGTDRVPTRGTWGKPNGAKEFLKSMHQIKESSNTKERCSLSAFHLEKEYTAFSSILVSSPLLDTQKRADNT